MSPGAPASPDLDAARRRLDKLEAEIQRAERHERAEDRREHPLGPDADGLGPTLGGDLMKPNPGRDLPRGDDTD